MTKRVMTIGLFFLASLAGGTVARAQAAQGDDGKAVYNQFCIQCHGVRGTPPKAMKSAFPQLPVFDAAFLGSHPEDMVVKVIGTGKNMMQPFKDKLTVAQIAAVAKYLRGLASGT